MSIAQPQCQHTNVGGGVVRSLVSVGMATFPADGVRAAALVAVADERMYAQKHAGRSGTPAPEVGDDRAAQRRRALSRLGDS